MHMSPFMFPINFDELNKPLKLSPKAEISFFFIDLNLGQKLGQT